MNSLLVKMERITKLLKGKTDGWVLPDVLRHSGTGYYYPRHCDKSIVSFYDGRYGFLIQVVATDKTTGEKKRSCFVIHERYENDSETINCDCMDDFYPSDIISDMDKFCKKLEDLVNGRKVEGFSKFDWETGQDVPSNLEFTLGTDAEKFSTKTYLTVVNGV